MLPPEARGWDPRVSSWASLSPLRQSAVAQGTQGGEGRCRVCPLACLGLAPSTPFSHFSERWPAPRVPPPLRFGGRAVDTGLSIALGPESCLTGVGPSFP